MDEFAKRLDDHTVQFVRILPGPIERIWEYLWDGKKRGEWFASGAMPKKAGESFEMRFKHSELSPHQAPPPEKFTEMDKTGHTATNILLAYEPPRRLVFTFGPEARGYSEVEFRLDPEGDPKTTKCASLSPTAGFPTASMRWTCREDGTAISPYCKSAPMDIRRPPSGMCGAGMTGFTTNATLNARPQKLLASVPVGLG
jgi:uncharacterized protein YndB with AHSA1/START domain